MKITNAFVTLLSSEDYLDMVLILNKSLQMVQSKYPLVAMVTNDICSKELISKLEYNSILVEIIKPLSYGEETILKTKQQKLDYILNTASKLQVFNLHKLEKVVYIDADVMILENIDDLFNYPDGAILMNPEGYGISSLFVINPKNHIELDMYKTIIEHSFCWDGDLFSKLWFYVKSNKDYQIPDYYLSHYNPVKGCRKEAKAVHFQQHKKEVLDHTNRISKLYKYYLSLI